MRTTALGLLCAAIVTLGPNALSASPADRLIFKVLPVREEDLRPEDRLQAACDIAILVRDDLKEQKSTSKKAAEDFRSLLDIVCYSDRSIFHH